MRFNQQITLSIVSLAALFAAAAPSDDVVMPHVQRNTYLSHAKPPELFGFRTRPSESGNTIEGTAHLHPNQTATIALKNAPVPVIALRGQARHKRMNVLLDTSSPVSWVRFEKAQDFDAIFLGRDATGVQYAGTYNTGDAPAYAAVITNLRMDSLFIENTPFYVRMAIGSLGPLARGIQVPRVDAALGYDTLAIFEFVQFNFRGETVRFASTEPYAPDPDRLLTTAKIRTLPDHGLAVEGAVDGEPAAIILDFAGDFHFSRGDVKVKITKEVRLGTAVNKKVPTLLLPVSGTLPRAGRKLLEQYVVTICPKKGVVYFERFPE